MTNYLPSLEERKLRMFEDVCATCGDDGGSDSSAAAASDEPEEGPEQLLKALKMLKKKKKKTVTEDKKNLPVAKMVVKAGNLEMKDDPDREKRMKLLDRARKIRSQIK